MIIEKVRARTRQTQRQNGNHFIHSFIYHKVSQNALQ